MQPINKGIIDLLESYVEARPDEVCLYSETEGYTTVELHKKVQAVAAFLKEKGVNQGDYVGISATRTIKTVIVFLATQYLGAIAVMFDQHAPIEKSLSDFGKEIPLKVALDISGEGFAIGGEEINFDALNGQTEKPVIDLHAPALLIFTSGSTGKSKGVVLSQFGYVNHQVNFAPSSGVVENEKYIHLLPLSHVFGVAHVVDAIMHRIPNFFPKVIVPEYVLQCIEKYGFTRFGIVPSYALMLSELACKTNYDISTMRTIVLAAAPTTFEQFLFIQRSLGVKVVPAYGMSELTIVSSAGPEVPDEIRAGSVGKPLEFNEVNIAEDGEIFLKSPTLFLGYYGDEPLDHNEFFPTGDMGYIDDEGFLHITGRKKDIIIRHGNNLSPLMIESKLLKLPFVRMAAVVGIKDARSGEIPAAVIVLRPGTEYDAEAVKTVLNKLEMPKEIRVLPMLPMTASGKPDKMAIKKMFQQ